MKSTAIANLGWFLIGAGLGMAIGAALTRRQLEREIRVQVDNEVTSFKQYYIKREKRDVYADPKNLVDESDKEMAEEEEEEPWTGSPIPTPIKGEADRAKYERFDYRREIPKRDPKIAYVISQEEFEENPRNYDQRSITYFSKDDVLTEEHDTPLDDVVGLVGPVALDQFGHGSHDPHIVYVRNDRIFMDFEICYDPGSFEETVLGNLKHADTRKRKKFRIDDD